MKTFLTLFLMSCATLLCAQMTKATCDPRTGHYTIIDTPVLLVHDSTTANTITDKAGSTWPVYVGPKGGIYYYVQNDLGEWKKRYIKTVTK
jgi:hypothetical protein